MDLEKAVDAILADLTARFGFTEVWETMTPAGRAGLRSTWLHLLEEEAKAPEVRPPMAFNSSSIPLSGIVRPPKEVAELLWGMLDDIDSLGDSMKPEITPYFKAVNRITDKRHMLLKSDGYGLTWPCRACFKPLLQENRNLADGCPCNSGRGINHGLVPKNTCTCPICDPAQTGSARSV